MFNEGLFISLSQFSQYLKNHFKSVFTRKSSLKFLRVTSTKESHQIPNNHISVAEFLMMGEKNKFLT